MHFKLFQIKKMHVILCGLCSIQHGHKCPFYRRKIFRLNNFQFIINIPAINFGYRAGYTLLGVQLNVHLGIRLINFIAYPFAMKSTQQPSLPTTLSAFDPICIPFEEKKNNCLQSIIMYECVYISPLNYFYCFTDCTVEHPYRYTLSLS